MTDNPHWSPATPEQAQAIIARYTDPAASPERSSRRIIALLAGSVYLPSAPSRAARGRAQMRESR